MATIDVGLIRRYDRPGPRYTSYPTAPSFGPSFGPGDYARALAAGTGRPLSLYVHVPFCESVCWFCACSVVYTRRHAEAAPYLDLLAAEADLVRAAIRPGRAVTQLHLGGGTPTFLAPDEVRRLVGDLEARFPFEEDAERSLEVDPRVTTDAHLDAIAAAGFNRASVGIQDVDPEVQAAIHRIQPLEQTRRVIERLREGGVSSLSVDLIYGLPHQSVASHRRTLDAVLGLRPDRLALFNFAYVPWLKPHQRAIDESALPSTEERLAIFAQAVERLAEAGYRHIGLDHFALPTDDLAKAQDDGTLARGFQGYTTRGGADLVGLGATSIGDLGGAYAQNHKDLEGYGEAIAAGRLATERGLWLTDDDRIRRDAIMTLLCLARLDKRGFEARHGVRFDEYFAEARAELRPLVDDGLVEDTDEAIVVTDAGRHVIRNACMPFDAHLGGCRAAGQRFSRTV